MKAYLDTSVLVSYYTPEPRRAAVVEYLRAVTEPTISLLCVAEFHSAIAHKRKGTAAETNIDQALDLFQGHRRAGLYNMIGLQQPHFEQAIHLLDTTSTRLRTLDALHLAAARKAGIELATADKRLSDAADEINHPCQYIAL